MKRKASVYFKNMLLNGMVSLVAIALTLFLGEIAVRLLSPQQLTLQNNKVWMPDAVLGWKKAPLVNEQINTGEQPVWIATDSLGYRIGKQDSPAENCPHAILFLGDSFLEALQVENEDAFPGLTSRMLKEKRKEEYCAVNTGVGGWGLPQYYLQAKMELERRKYDLVIVSLFVGNDFILKFDTIIAPRQPTKKHRLRMPSSFDKKELQVALWRPIKNYFSARSHLFVLLKNSIEYYSSKSGDGEYIQQLFLKANRNGTFWDTTMYACKQLQALANKKNTPVVFCLVPANFQVHQSIFSNYLKASGIDPDMVDIEQPNEVFCKLMREQHLLILDPLHYLQEKGKSYLLYGEVDRHFNNKGHQFMAEYIYPAVDSLLRQ